MDLSCSPLRRIRPVSPDPAWSASPAADRSDHWRIRSA